MIVIGKENKIGKKYFNKKVEFNKLSEKYGNKYPGGLLISYLLGKCEKLNKIEVQIDIAGNCENDETSCVYTKEEFAKDFKIFDDFLELFEPDDVESWNVTIMYEKEEIRIFGILYNPLSYEVNISYESNNRADKIIDIIEDSTLE